MKRTFNDLVKRKYMNSTAKYAAEYIAFSYHNNGNTNESILQLFNSSLDSFVVTDNELLTLISKVKSILLDKYKLRVISQSDSEPLIIKKV